MPRRSAPLVIESLRQREVGGHMAAAATEGPLSPPTSLNGGVVLGLKGTIIEFAARRI